MTMMTAPRPPAPRSLWSKFCCFRPEHEAVDRYSSLDEQPVCIVSKDAASKGTEQPAAASSPHWCAADPGKDAKTPDLGAAGPDSSSGHSSPHPLSALPHRKLSQAAQRSTRRASLHGSEVLLQGSPAARDPALCSPDPRHAGRVSFSDLDTVARDQSVASPEQDYDEAEERWDARSNSVLSSVRSGLTCASRLSALSPEGRMSSLGDALDLAFSPSKGTSRAATLMDPRALSVLRVAEDAQPRARRLELDSAGNRVVPRRETAPATSDTAHTGKPVDQLAAAVPVPRAPADPSAGTVFREEPWPAASTPVDMSPDLYGPPDPLPFIDPTTRWQPIPKVTPYIGYWSKIPEQSSPLPMPIDVAFASSWMVRKAHESIRGIKVVEDDKHVSIRAKVTVLGGSIIHKETFPKDGSVGRGIMRRDVKPGYATFRGYLAHTGELVLVAYMHALNGRLDTCGVDVLRLIEGGEVIQCMQAAWCYNTRKWAFQKFIARRSNVYD